MRSHPCPSWRAWNVSSLPEKAQQASAFSPGRVSCRSERQCDSPSWGGRLRGAGVEGLWPGGGAEGAWAQPRKTRMPKESLFIRGSPVLRLIGNINSSRLVEGNSGGNSYPSRECPAARTRAQPPGIPNVVRRGGAGTRGALVPSREADGMGRARGGRGLGGLGGGGLGHGVILVGGSRG